MDRSYAQRRGKPRHGWPAAARPALINMLSAVVVVGIIIFLSVIGILGAMSG